MVAGATAAANGTGDASCFDAAQAHIPIYILVCVLCWQVQLQQLTSPVTRRASMLRRLIYRSTYLCVCCGGRCNCSSKRHRWRVVLWCCAGSYTDLCCRTKEEHGARLLWYESVLLIAKYLLYFIDILHLKLTVCELIFNYVFLFAYCESTTNNRHWEAWCIAVICPLTLLCWVFPSIITFPYSSPPCVVIVSCD